MRLVALVITFTLTPFVQSKPNFSGHWVIDSQPTPITGRIPICNTDCTLTQTVETLTVSEGMHGKSYALTGIAAEVLAKSPDVTARITTTAKWDGAVLAISELIASADLNGGKPFTTTARLSLAGDRLIIEGIRSTNDGAVDNFKVIYKHAGLFSAVR